MPGKTSKLEISNKTEFNEFAEQCARELLDDLITNCSFTPDNPEEEIQTYRDIFINAYKQNQSKNIAP